MAKLYKTATTGKTVLQYFSENKIPKNEKKSCTNCEKFIPSFSATKRYRFLSFPSCHSGDIKIACCISELNINISVRIFVNKLER